MGGIDLNKYLTDIPEYTTGRLRYNPVNMLKTVLFGFMTSGYCSLRELEGKEELYECEDCSGCSYAEKCKKTDKNRTIRYKQKALSEL